MSEGTLESMAPTEEPAPVTTRGRARRASTTPMNGGSVTVKLPTAQPDQQPAPQTEAQPPANGSYQYQHAAQPQTQHQSPSFSDNANDLEMLAEAASGTVQCERIAPEEEDGVRVWTGMAGRLPINADLVKEIGQRWGGRDWLVHGIVKGKKVTVPVKIPGKAKPIAPPEDVEESEPRQTAAQAQQEAAAFAFQQQLRMRQLAAGQPIVGMGVPTQPYQLPVTQQVTAQANAEVKALRDEIEKLKVEKAQADARLTIETLKAGFDKQIEALKTELIKNRAPTVDPAAQFFGFMQAQAQADQARAAAAETARAAADARDRQDRIDRDARESAQRDAMFKLAVEKSDPTKVLLQIAELNKAINPGAAAGAVSEMERFKSFMKTGKEMVGFFGEGPKSETIEKIEATERLISSSAKVVSEAFCDLAPNLAQAWAILRGRDVDAEAEAADVASKRRTARAAQVRANRDKQAQINAQRQLQIAQANAKASQATANAQAAPASPGFAPTPVEGQAQPATPTTPPAASSGFDETEGDDEEDDDENEEPLTDEEKAEEEQESMEKFVKLVNFVAKAYNNKNEPVASASALRVFSAGAESDEELASLCKAEYAFLKAQLGVGAATLQGEAKEAAEKAFAITVTPEGEVWLKALLEATRASFGG